MRRVFAWVKRLSDVQNLRTLMLEVFKCVKLQRKSTHYVGNDFTKNFQVCSAIKNKLKTMPDTRTQKFGIDYVD